MYRHILIPTDGSELAERAVTHGLSLAKFLGAKVTAVTVDERLGAWLSFAESGVTEAFAQYYTEQIKKHVAGFARHPKIAGERHRQTCPGRGAIQLRHHGLWHLVQDARHLHAASKVRKLCLERQRRPALCHRLDIAADAEGTAGALEQHGTYLVILRRAPRRFDQTPRHVRIERVAPVRAVHGDGEETGLELLQDHFIRAHGCCLLLLVGCPSGMLRKH